MSFLDLDVDLFIKEVEKQPALYNKRIRDYNDRSMRENLWLELAGKFVANWDELPEAKQKLKGKELQMRWRNLRTCFKREFLKTKTAQARPAGRRRRPYIFFKQLSFLLPYVEETDNDGSLVNSSVEDEEIEKDLTVSLPNKVNTKFGKTNQMKSDEEEIDEDRYFVLSMLPTFKKCDEDQKFVAKTEIMKLLRRIRLSQNIQATDTNLAENNLQQEIVEKLLELEQERCRVCLETRKTVLSIDSTIQITSNPVSLSEVLRYCSDVQVFPDDCKPQYICSNCVQQGISAYRFKNLCENSEKILQEEIKNHRIKTDNLNLTDVEEEIADIVTVKEETPEPRPEEVYIKEEPFSEGSDCEMEDGLAETLSDEEEIKDKDQKQRHRTQEVPLNQRTCDICDMVFTFRFNMLKHKRKHGIEKKCEHCEYFPKNYVDLAKHMEQDHLDKKIIKCPVCEKCFFRKKNCDDHILTHTGEKPHICNVCGAGFALSGNLTAHKRLHTGKKPYECTECHKKFSHRSTLRNHMLCHSDKKEFKCKVCAGSFSKPHVLKKHEKTHLDGEQPFKCFLCEKSFENPKNRTEHENEEHKGAKIYECQICSRQFDRRNNLSGHLNTHAVLKPHKCELCGKGFTEEHYLLSHQKKHTAEGIKIEENV